MNFSSDAKLREFLRKPQIKFLDFGSQGQCYYDRLNNKVYKIFFDFFDDDDDYIYQVNDNILKFSKITNSTYIWPSDFIKVNDKVVGYITNYGRGENLYKIDPLNVNLFNLVDKLGVTYKDNIVISQNSIVTYDVMYNILYGKDGIKIIDSDDYNFDIFGRNYEEILKINNRNINFAFKVFLIDNYFNEFVNQFCELRDMYEDLDLESRVFIINLQKKFSELLGFKLIFLKDALNFKNKRKIKEKDLKMVRLLY